MRKEKELAQKLTVIYKKQRVNASQMNEGIDIA